MPEQTWMLLTGAAMATVIGFAWLALAMNGHWHRVHGGKSPAPAVRISLRALGIAGLLASAVLCCIADHPSMAVLVWLMLLAGSVPLVALILAWRPRLLRVLWPWGGQGAKGARGM
ncbi:hypothetical protein D3C78_1251270 [compost metagenome]